MRPAAKVTKIGAGFSFDSHIHVENVVNEPRNPVPTTHNSVSFHGPATSQPSNVAPITLATMVPIGESNHARTT